MSRSLLPEAVERYVTQEIAHETDVQRRLRAETAGMPHAGMQIGADQGALLTLLAKLVGARRAIEIGTFTGYSALAVASALPADGKLICCDVSEEWTSVARRYWQEAGVAGRIELRLAPATDTLAALLTQGGAETFDFAFIDADKENYAEYLDWAARHLRKGGVVVADNAFLFGEIVALMIVPLLALHGADRKVAAAPPSISMPASAVTVAVTTAVPQAVDAPKK